MTRHRGTTLLEVMTAGAIMAVMMTVATSVFVAMTKQKREAERFLEVEATSMSAISQMQLDVTNAGYRFPAPAFGVHVYNNVASLPAGGGGAIVIDSSSNCGTGGLAPGSDAIEVVMGSPAAAAGKVQFVDSFAPPNPSTDHNIVLVSATPFTTFDVGPSGVALFYGLNGESCIGEVTSGPGVTAPPNMNVTMLTRDFEPVASASTYYPNCPTAGMSVYRLASRKRFFLCAEPTLADGGGALNALYAQEVADGGLSYDLSPPVQLQTGIEDLQIAARVTAGAPNALTAASTDCFAATGVGKPFCMCNESPTSACDFTLPVTAMTNAEPAAAVSNVQLTLTTLGMRPATDPSPTAGRPASKDHAVGTAYDQHRRLQTNVTVGMMNFTQVKP